MYKEYNPNDILYSLHIPKSGGTSFRKALIQWFTHKNRQFIDYEKRPNVQLQLRWFVERGLPQTIVGDNLYVHYKNHLKEDIPNIVYKLEWLGRLSNKPKCIHGHFNEKIDGVNLFDIYPQANQFIAFMRDPLELHLSLFHYHLKMQKTGGVMFKGRKSKPLDLDVDEWLEERELNALRFFPFDFNIDNFKSIINDNFIHIGVTEHLDNSLHILSEKLSVPKVEVPVLNTSERMHKPSESSILKFKKKHKLEIAIYDYVLSHNS